MEYTIAPTTANTATITIGSNGYTVSVNPTKIVPITHTEDDADVDFTPSVTPTTNVYELTGSSGDEYVITFNEDGVYKLAITENGVDYLHIFICVADIDETLFNKINDILCISECPNNTNSCLCDNTCMDYYGFNIMALICMTFFGEDNMGVAFNYEVFDSGAIYEGYQYKCETVGSGTFNWKDSDGNTLLVDSMGNAVSTGTLVEDATYTCIKSGIPVEYGSVDNTELTGLTSNLSLWLNYVADSIDRFERYNTDNSNCSC